MDEPVRFYLAKIQTKKKWSYNRELPNLHLFKFVAMISNLLSRRGKWVPYKHMYYVSQHVMFYV